MHLTYLFSSGSGSAFNCRLACRRLPSSFLGVPRKSFPLALEASTTTTSRRNNKRNEKRQKAKIKAGRSNKTTSHTQAAAPLSAMKMQRTSSFGQISYRDRQLHDPLVLYSFLRASFVLMTKFFLHFSSHELFSVTPPHGGILGCQYGSQVEAHGPSS